MPFYIGNECPACGKVFAEGDDIVVCPICGTPHHRECYKSLGHCGNEGLHAADKQWEPDPAVAAAMPKEQTVCPQCGEANPAGNFFCQRCGQRMGADAADAPGQPRQQQGQQPGMGGFMGFMQSNLDYSQELAPGVTVKEACDYVGPNNVTFAMRFRALTRGGSTFNWGAFFFGFYYCFYRKMYKLGAILAGIFVLAAIPTGYYSAIAISDILAAGGALSFPIQFVMEGAGYKGLLMATSISRVVSLATTLYCGFFFNKAYFSDMVKKIKQVKATGHFSTGSQEYSYALYRAGGVNMGMVLLVAAATIAGYFAYGFIASYFILL